jgi:hypothetical protein
MSERAVPAISLYESNPFSGQYFQSLVSGKGLHSHRWEALTVDDTVISQVEELAEDENQAILSNKMPLVEWGTGIDLPAVPYEPVENDDNDTLDLDQEAFDPVPPSNVISDDDDTVSTACESDVVDVDRDTTTVRDIVDETSCESDVVDVDRDTTTVRDIVDEHGVGTRLERPRFINRCHSFSG